MVITARKIQTGDATMQYLDVPPSRYQELFGLKFSAHVGMYRFTQTHTFQKTVLTNQVSSYYWLKSMQGITYLVKSKNIISTRL